MRDFIDNARLTLAYLPTRAVVGIIAALALLVWLGGCRTLTLASPRTVDIRCRKAAPGHWRVVVDGTERIRLTFPGEVPEVLPCPAR